MRRRRSSGDVVRVAHVASALPAELRRHAVIHGASDQSRDAGAEHEGDGPDRATGHPCASTAAISTRESSFSLRGLRPPAALALCTTAFSAIFELLEHLRIALLPEA